MEGATVQWTGRGRAIAVAVVIAAGGCGDDMPGDADAGLDQPDAGNVDASTDAPVDGAAPCVHDYREGHGDMYATWDEAAGFQLDVRSELVPGLGELRYPPPEVCIHVPRSTYDEVLGFGGRPAGPGWDGLGVPEGQPFWYLPEVAIDGVPWFGIASDPGKIGGVQPGVFGDELTLMLTVAAPAGAHFSAWGTVDDPENPPFIFSTQDDLLSAAVITSSHAHLSWGFTAAGEYRVTATMSGTRSADGEVRTSPPVTYRFIVAP